MKGILVVTGLNRFTNFRQKLGPGIEALCGVQLSKMYSQD